MANEAGAINLDEVDDETKEKLAKLAAQHHVNPEPDGSELTGHHAATAFLVVINHDNSVFASQDANLDVVLDRMATPFDLQHGAQQVLNSMTATQIAGTTHQLMMQATQQMQQQMLAAQQEKAIREKLKI